MLDLDADQTPRAARDVDGCLGLHRHRDDGRRGVVRADRDDVGLPAERRRDRGPQRADPRAGRDQRRQNGAQPGEAERVEERIVPRVVAPAQQARRRGVGHLGARLAGQPEREQVGDEQGRVGDLEQRRRLGGELVQRVEGQELQAVAFEQLGVRHPFVHRSDAPSRALVAVVERCAEQGALGGAVAARAGGFAVAVPAAQQAVVDRPRVDADARELGFARERGAQPFECRAVQADDVPVQSVAEDDRVVREPRHGRGLEYIGPDASDDHAPARGTEVDRRDRPRLAHARTPDARPVAARPAVAPLPVAPFPFARGRDTPSAVTAVPRVATPRGVDEEAEAAGAAEEAGVGGVAGVGRLGRASAGGIADVIAGMRRRRPSRRECAGPWCG